MQGFIKVVYKNEGALKKSPRQEKIMISGYRLNLGDRPVNIGTMFEKVVKDLDKQVGYDILEVERVISLNDPGDIVFWFTFVPKDQYVLPAL
jgi:hypothetical protein